MRNNWRAAAGVILAAGVLGACNGEIPSDPNNAGGAIGVLAAAEEVCTTVDFSGFGHGDPVNGLTVFGEAITVTTSSFNAAGTSGAGTNQARAFDGQTTHPE
ncbi:MAG: hypothetical protein M8866_08365, partial [marine benthic group bacterium]|nr:hypothetical protein [Candidatus Benthicola marisminoris]